MREVLAALALPLLVISIATSSGHAQSANSVNSGGGFGGGKGRRYLPPWIVRPATVRR